MQKLTDTYLVLRFQSLGNVAMMAPILASVAMQQPDAKFVVLARKRLADMFVGLPNVIFHSADKENHPDRSKSVLHIFRELSDTHGITQVIDLQNNNRSRRLDFLFFITGRRITRLHSARMAQRRLCKHGYAESQPLPTEFSRYADTFFRAGLRSDNAFCSIPVNTEAADAVTARFGEHKGTWLGIAPFAKSRTNMLPYRISKEVIARFSKRPDTRLFLFGAGNVECEMLRQWAGVFQNVESVAGQLSLAEELELMRRLDLMLCMDSANQHLASLVALRCLSVWCGTHPYTGFYGWKQRPEDNIQQPLSCRPCTMHGKNRCSYRNFLCRNFTSAEITERVESALGGLKGLRPI